MNVNLNGRTMSALIDFNFIIDTDIGLIRFIRKNFNDERAFISEIINKSDREILSLLYCRKNWNPLSIITTEENKNNIDKLYDSFFRDYKKEIIHLSVSKNSILDFTTTMLIAGSSSGFSTKIFINDKIEKEFVARHINRPLFLSIEDKKTIMTMDPFYIKDYRFFLNNNIEVSGKNIYLLGYDYNIDYYKNTDSKLTRNNSTKTIQLN